VITSQSGLLNLTSCRKPPAGLITRPTTPTRQSRTSPFGCRSTRRRSARPGPRCRHTRDRTARTGGRRPGRGLPALVAGNDGPAQPDARQCRQTGDDLQGTGRNGRHSRRRQAQDDECRDLRSEWHRRSERRWWHGTPARRGLTPARCGIGSLDRRLHLRLLRIGTRCSVASSISRRARRRSESKVTCRVTLSPVYDRLHRLAVPANFSGVSRTAGPSARDRRRTTAPRRYGAADRSAAWAAARRATGTRYAEQLT
jgi:hypothetical protein